MQYLRGSVHCGLDLTALAEFQTFPDYRFAFAVLFVWYCLWVYCTKEIFIHYFHVVHLYFDWIGFLLAFLEIMYWSVATSSLFIFSFVNYFKAILFWIKKLMCLLKSCHNINICTIMHIRYIHIHENYWNDYRQQLGRMAHIHQGDESLIWYQILYIYLLLFAYMKSQNWNYGFCSCFIYCYGLLAPSSSPSINFLDFIILCFGFLFHFHLCAWMFIDFSIHVFVPVSFYFNSDQINCFSLNVIWYGPVVRD